ncbi:DUF6504 family protein [Sphingomonas sp.]|uniref:DUF6504 family protein n=1 Tax=Sphingomonas sp. TaxID=28214 RepID=UPI003AFFA7B7
MKRVASLYLPHWSIDRLRRIERRSAPPAETDGRAVLDALGAEAAAERALHCSVPKQGGWRPGARWAKVEKADVEAAIESLPPHRRPPQRELGRTSEAAEVPFRDGPSRKGLSHPPEERVPAPAPLREMARRTEAAVPLFKPGARGWSGADLQAAADALPAHQRPSFQELSRRSEVVDNPFRPMSPDDGAGFVPAFAASSLLAAQKVPRRSARDGHGGEAGYVAPPNLAQSLKQLAVMPAVQFPGEGPHPDNHGKSEPAYGKGRFFQTGRTLGSVVARVCRDEEAPAPASQHVAPPLVTTHKVGARVEIAAVDPAAAALGLAPGTALTMARAQVPGLEVRAADPAGDAADLRAFGELLARRWSPTVAVSDADGLFIDLTGVAHLHGGEERFARRLIRLLTRHGITARIAVADTAGAAWAMARFDCRTSTKVVPVEAGVSVLARLPVAALRLDPPSLELLARLGIDRIGQLLALPRAPLVRRFGRAIVARLDQTTGRAPEPLEPIVPPTRIAVEQRFAEPIATPDAIEHWLRALIARLCVALAQAGQGARAVELIAARVDGVPQRLRIGLARPSRDPTHLLRLTLRRIEEIEPGYGLDALALHVRRADPLGPESLAPTLAETTAPDLAPLVDALANRIGMARLWRMTPVESDVPERSLAPASPLDPPADRATRLKADDVRLLDGRAPDHPWHPRWARPVRLLRRPEQVDHVMAELPDQPPRRFTWRGHTHRVVRAEGPERIAGEWWRRAGERQAVRDYFRVEDEAGQRFWLYRRGDGVRAETGDLRWFLHAR